MHDSNSDLMAGILIAAFTIFALAGTALAISPIPPKPHRAFGYVTYEDGSPATGVTVRFVDNAGVAVASDVTNETGYYDTSFLPGIENDIPEPEDKTLDIFVGDWDSGKVLEWESGGSGRIDISDVPIERPGWFVDSDDEVGLSDLMMVAGHFGEFGAPGWIRADVDQNGEVGLSDLMMVAGHFGETR